MQWIKIVICPTYDFYVTHSHIQPTMNDQWLTIMFIVIDVVISSEQFMLRQSVPTHLPNHQLVRCLPQQSCKGLPQPLILGLRQGLWCVPFFLGSALQKIGRINLNGSYQFFGLYWVTWFPMFSSETLLSFWGNHWMFKNAKNLPTSWKIQTSSCSQRNI